MYNFTKTLSVILPLIALSLIVLVLGINLYFKVRRRFPITVNCWFCNSWIKVAYEEKDCFDCPECFQYNGFNKDGGYNKIIPAQHDELLNARTSQIKSNNKNATNGLCMLCNNNQQLKIFQLAHFVPLNEENYDVEIEHFQKQLEKAYKLCKKCDKVLKTTIEKQNAWIFGNHIKNLGKKGLSLFDLNRSSHGFKKEYKQLIFLKFISCVTILFGLLIIINNVSLKFYSLSNYFSKYIPTSALPYISLLENNSVFAVQFVKESKIVSLISQFIPKHFNHSNSLIAFLSCGGFLSHIIFMILDKYTTTIKINQFLCWIILLLTSWIRLNKKFAIYVYFLQIFCALYVISGMTISKNIETKQLIEKEKFPAKRKSIRKFVRNLENTCSDLSDQFDNISSSSEKIEANSAQSISEFSNSSMTAAGVPHWNSTVNFNATQQNKTVFPNYIHTANSVLDESFNTAKSVVSEGFSNNFNSSFSERKAFDLDLHKSLDNLHLGNLNYKPLNPVLPTATLIKRPKPVLSPSRLKTFTQNSWVAGGFWRNPNGLHLPPNHQYNLSRSSSQSSGFESQTNDNNLFSSLPPSQNNSVFGDFDKTSIISEPAYHMKLPNGFSGSQNVCGCHPNYLNNNSNLENLHSTTNNRQLYYRTDNTFYPILNNRNLLLIQGNNGPNSNLFSSSNYSNNLSLPNNNFVMTKSMFLDDTHKGESLFKFSPEKISLDSFQNFKSNDDTFILK